MNTIPEHEADETVKKQYNLLKTAFGSAHVPLFFTYIGPFPNYLTYITEQIVRITHDTRFEKLNMELGQDINRLIHTMLPLSPEVLDLYARYQHTPSFYNLERDLWQVYKTNIRLALLFVALRESVKGWAVAAKQLPKHAGATELREKMKEEDASHVFVLQGYEAMQNTYKSAQDDRKANEIISTRSDENIQERDGIEVNLFPQYLRLQQEEFFSVVKTEQYVYLRVYIEELLLASLPHLPHPLVSPINVVLELTSEYKNFPDLLYLVSEHFPTLAVQRLIFSGYVLSK